MLHCPYYHNIEYGSQRLSVLQTVQMSAHQGLLIAEWGPTTLYLNGSDMPSVEVQGNLACRAVSVRTDADHGAPRGEGTALSWLLLGDGREAPSDTLHLAPRSRLNSPIAEQLGCALDVGPFGPVIRTDAAKMPGMARRHSAAQLLRFHR